MGDVAQLEEHLLCKQGVVGSIPIVSTRILPGWLWADRLAGSYRGISEIGVVMRWNEAFRRVAARVCSFVMVNQVLVRLWARVIQAGPYGLVKGPVVRLHV